MGIKPEVIVAPLAMAEFAQRAATFQKLARSPALEILKQEIKIFQNKLKVSPALESINKEIQEFQNHIKAFVKKSGIAELTKQIKNTYGKVKTWFKKLFVKYLPIALPLTEIPRAQIQPSFGKSLQLPNSYRSHSPPLYSVIV